MAGTERHLSLWLIPHESMQKPLNGLIESLSQKHHGTPPTGFPAHLTLLAGVYSAAPDVELQAMLVRLLESYTISRALSTSIDIRRQLILQFRAIEARDFLWQSLIALTTKTEALLELHQEAKRIFGQRGPPPNATYDPHVSLLYSEKNIEERKGIIKDLSNGKDAKLKRSPARLGQSEERWIVAGVEEFVPGEISLVELTPRVEDWRVIAKVTL